MASILVHITNGPEHPTRAALGLLVAKAALEEGHQVTVFLAGDAVQLIRDEVLASLQGVGTGSAGEHFKAVQEGGANLYLSRMSSNARGVTEDDATAKGGQMATPNMLVGFALDHDRMFTY